MSARFTGRHITAILVGFFGVVVAVNFLMASLAVSEFGGAVVENSYVASQKFNGWLGEARAERAYGWGARFARDGEGRLEVTTQGTPGDLAVCAELRHPLGREEARQWALVPRGGGRFVSRDRLPEGRWLVRATLTSGQRQLRLERPIG
jgi:nitrogen fixation protein FixH